MQEFTIGEIARYAGLQTSAIRYYESVGLLPPPKRVNGRRRYDPTVLKRLGLIQLVRQAGFGIREIQALFGSLSPDASDTIAWQTLAAAKIVEMDALIQRTQAARAWLAEALQVECEGVEDCVQISFDENTSGMTITLTCHMPLPDSADGITNSLNLLTMSEHPDN